MNTDYMIETLSYVGIASCAFAMLIMYLKDQFSNFKFLALFLCVRLASELSLRAVMCSYGHYGFAKHTTYQIYFYIYWISFAVEALVGIGTVYDIYKLAMAPLPGLQRLGLLMFRWATAIALTVAVGMAVGPSLHGNPGLIHLVLQMQQTSAIITLCLLLFVCLAIHPMGLSYRSKIFGVSIGLGILSFADLAGSAWLQGTPQLVSSFNLINAVVFCIVLSTWMTYFVMPEPKRRIIMLPTTSPFLRWNQISIALGDEPGYVAIAGIPPDIFAPAELEIMRRASLKMKSNN